MVVVSLVLPTFLSTPSARRATYRQLSDICISMISIHALREEGDGRDRALYRPVDISIHALREEGDPRRRPPPCLHPISIHALREEGDS